MLVYIAATLISCLLAVWCEKRNTDALTERRPLKVRIRTR